MDIPSWAFNNVGQLMLCKSIMECKEIKIKENPPETNYDKISEFLYNIVNYIDLELNFNLDLFIELYI